MVPMTTETKIWLSAFVWVAGLGWFWPGEPTLAAVVGCTHVIVFFLHHIEVKLNKLLDRAGIFVSKAELQD